MEAADTRAPSRAAPDPASERSARQAEFAEYLAARQPRLLRTAYLICGNPDVAEEVVQDAMAKLYLAWDRVRDLEHRDAYVRRMVVNENTSWWRRRARRREVVTDRPPDPGHLDHYDDGAAGELWQFVQTLPPKQRAVVVLRYYEELSEAEAAEVLGVAVGTVKSQCSRALATLRDRAPTSLDPHPHDAEEER